MVMAVWWTNCLITGIGQLSLCMHKNMPVIHHKQVWHTGWDTMESSEPHRLKGSRCGCICLQSPTEASSAKVVERKSFVVECWSESLTVSRLGGGPRTGLGTHQHPITIRPFGGNDHWQNGVHLLAWDYGLKARLQGFFVVFFCPSC